MAMKLYSETDIRAIADGIRKLTGETGTYTVAQMGAAVADYWGDFSPIAASTEDNGQPYNGGLGYKLGYRTNSSGLEAANGGFVCTGFIPAVTGDTVRVNLGSPDFYPMYVNIYDSARTQIRILPFPDTTRDLYSFEIKVSIEGACYLRFSAGDITSAADAEKMRIKIIEGVSA